MMLLLQCCVAFAATVAFAVLFQVPFKQFLFCGLTGAVCWLFYSLSLQFCSPSSAIASFVAVIFLTALSRALAVFRKCPVTIFLICGIFPIVPGAGIYYTAYYFIMNENSLALNKGIETIKIAVAIALAIVFVLSLPNFLFRHLRIIVPK